ncbi:type VI secretion system (T6SS) VipA/Hcp2 family protein [Neolewinella xylanilytica]|uniref:Type VI secretion system (T6SS) VipA/Hcp2 family protein n=1 Tax=Neolewinella xylanilytica TaxID=1514080 RepID=A0A2S6IB85_9BACT|nr:type VI secretion system contractile sheath small subunit [Neolewinella xylanilytica]PPK88773.1 type VI secretion system (T6SS) VipA/Hcp2 family protein [Neolewinella xylanilytica]
MADFTSNQDLRKNGFIYETVDAANEAMADIPKNRTILTADLTDKPATRPEMTYELETIEDVFEHFQPSVKMEFNDAEGASINEELHFTNLGDFGEKALLRQSEFLGKTSQQRANYSTFATRLQNNKVLQRVLSDPEKKEAYLTVLRSMLQELEDEA